MSAGAISPTAASTAATGPPATSAAPAVAPSSSASRRPASPASGPTPPPASTATSSTSSASPPARARFAPPSPRRAPSSPCRPRPSPLPPTPTTARRRRAACGSAAAPSTAPMPRPIYAPGRSTAAASPRSASTPRSFYRDGGGMRRLPALVAAVTGDAGEHPGPREHLGQRTITGVHRTWLDPSLPAKAPVPRPRKALGRVHGLAVRFGDARGQARHYRGEPRPGRPGDGAAGDRRRRPAPHRRDAVGEAALQRHRGHRRGPGSAGRRGKSTANRRGRGERTKRRRRRPSRRSRGTSPQSLITARTDDGRRVTFRHDDIRDWHDNIRLDYGYAMTIASAQGLTVDRVLYRRLFDDGFPGLFRASEAWISHIVRALPDR